MAQNGTKSCINQIQKSILETNNYLFQKKHSPKCNNWVKFLVVLNKFFWAPVIQFTMMLGLVTIYVLGRRSKWMETSRLYAQQAKES